MEANMKSIIQENKDKCFLCGYPLGLEKHHIFFGKNRKHADKYGLTIYLCAECHRGSVGVHGKNGHIIDSNLKQFAQKKFEIHFGHEKFMQIFKKNYLE